MKYLSKLFLTSGISILIFTSCKNISDTKTSASAKQVLNSVDYFPLSIGKRLEYSFIASNTFKSDRGKMVMKIDEKEIINNKEYYKMILVYSEIPGAEAETYYCRKAQDGIYAIDGKNKLSPEYLYIKLPLEVGVTWKSFTPNGVIDNRVEGIETLELVDKKYKDCLKITFNKENADNGYIYLFKGIGAVKQVILINGTTLDYTLLN